MSNKNNKQINNKKQRRTMKVVRATKKQTKVAKLKRMASNRKRAKRTKPVFSRSTRLANQPTVLEQAAKIAFFNVKVDGTGAENKFVNLEFNPGMHISRWVTSLASHYQSYVVKSLRFIFETTRGEDTSGFITMAPNYNANNDNIDISLEELQQMGDSQTGKVNRNLTVSCSKINFRKENQYQTRFVEMEDKRLTDVCTLNVIVSSDAPEGLLGCIYVAYDFQLITPKLADVNEADCEQHWLETAPVLTSIDNSYFPESGWYPDKYERRFIEHVGPYINGEIELINSQKHLGQDNVYYSIEGSQSSLEYCGGYPVVTAIDSMNIGATELSYNQTMGVVPTRDHKVKFGLDWLTYPVKVLCWGYKNQGKIGLAIKGLATAGQTLMTTTTSMVQIGVDVFTSLIAALMQKEIMLMEQGNYFELQYINPHRGFLLDRGLSKKVREHFLQVSARHAELVLKQDKVSSYVVFHDVNRKHKHHTRSLDDPVKTATWLEKYQIDKHEKMDFSNPLSVES
jgi:hypothetical protein